MNKSAIVGLIKKKRSAVIIILGLIAAVLLIFAGSFGKNEKLPADDSDQLISYARELERKTAELIERLDGVSGVSVAIVLEGGKENVYAEDGEVSGGGKSSRYVTASGGALLLKELAPKVSGVAVVCSASGSAAAEARITRMLSALFDLPSNHIFVST